MTKGLVQLSNGNLTVEEATWQDRSKAASIGDLNYVFSITQGNSGAIDGIERDIKNLSTTVIEPKIDEKIKAIGGNTAEAGKFVTAAKVNDEGKLAVSTAALQVSDIPDLTTAKITDLNDVLGNKQDNLEFMTAYSATDNKVATAKDIEAAKAAVTGT